MKKTVSFCLSLILSFVCLIVPADADTPDFEEIRAEAAVLLDAETGQILYAKQADERMYPASITKIMTGLLAVEYLDKDDVLTASSTAADVPYWGSSAFIQAGEQLTVEQIMYAMMLKSANEAANVLAEEVGGSLDGFARLMNERAKELGAKGTHFTNANGLPEQTHYTTAYDMALITREAIQYREFLTYFSAQTYFIDETNKFGARAFTNTHRMLLQNSWQYDPEVIGGKTGYTVQSGNTLVTVAQRNGRTLICVILKSNDSYNDTRALLEYGFEDFKTYTYVFEENEPIEISIWEEDWEAGKAYLTYPEEACVVLPYGVDAESIVEEYVYPETLSTSDDIEAEVLLKLSQVGTSSLPETILSLPMEVEVVEFEPPAVEVLADISPEIEGSENSSDSGGWIIGALIVAALAGVVCMVFKGRRRTGFRR